MAIEGHIQPRADTAANFTSEDPVLAVNELAIETDTLFMKLGDGSTAWTSLPYAASPPATIEESKSITIDEPATGDDVTMFFTREAITVTRMRAVVRGTSPSVTWTIRHHATDRSNAGNEVVTSGTTTTSQTAGSDVSSFNDATIPANSFVWLEVSADSGTNVEISVSVFFTRD